METQLKNSLNQICLELTNKIEMNSSNIPTGSCYLLGHCLSEGLSKSGFIAKETTGNLILQDKNRKSIVYGKSKYKGKSVGYYHTWCVLDFGEKIIIDPSLKYNKIFLKKNLNIKLNEHLPDCLITSENPTWYYNYLEDSSLIPLSKNILNKMDQEIVKILIDKVSEITDIVMNSYRKIDKSIPND